MSDVGAVTAWHDAVDACPCRKVSVRRYTDPRTDTMLGQRSEACDIHT